MKRCVALRSFAGLLAAATVPACSGLAPEEPALTYATFASIECGVTSALPLLDELPQHAHVLDLDDGAKRILFWGEPGSFRWDHERLGPPPAHAVFHGTRHGAVLLIDAKARVTDWAYLGPDGYRRLRVASVLGREGAGHGPR